MEAVRNSLFVLLFSVCFIFCEKFPSNPTYEEPDPNGVSIKHIEINYVSADPPADGMIATKVNIISFRFAIRNLKVKALEFYGKAVLDGPPDDRVYAIHFRTDSLGLKPEDTEYQFNVLEEIEPESTYVIVRPQYPTNEYAPFVDDRGRIKSIKIYDVWAHREDGTTVSLSFIDSLTVF